MVLCQSLSAEEKQYYEREADKYNALNPVGKDEPLANRRRSGRPTKSPLSKSEKSSEPKKLQRRRSGRPRKSPLSKSKESSEPKKRRGTGRPRKQTGAASLPARSSTGAASLEAASETLDNRGSGAIGSGDFNAQVDLLVAHQQEVMAGAQLEDLWAMQQQQLQMASLGSPPREMFSPEHRRYHDQVMHDAAMALYDQPWIPSPTTANYQSETYSMQLSNVPAIDIPGQHPQGNLHGAPPLPGDFVPPENVHVAQHPQAETEEHEQPPVAAEAVASLPSSAAPVASPPTRTAAEVKASSPSPAVPEQKEEQEVASHPVEQEEEEDTEEEDALKGLLSLPASLRVVLLPVVVAIVAYFAFRFSNPIEEEQVYVSVD